MRRALAAVVALASLIASGVAIVPVRAAEPRLAVVGERRVTDRLREVVLRSPALDADTTVRILLPTGYDPRADADHPVLYLLHGCCDDFRSWYDKTDLAAFTAPLDVVVVMPDGGQAGMYSDWWNHGAGGAPRWETYHIRELLPWVERTYDVRRDRGGRMIAGLSMGGLGSFGYAARHPHLFASAAAFSPLVDTNLLPGGVVAGDVLPMLDGGLPTQVWGPRPTEEIRWRGHNPWDLAENLSTLQLWVRTGDGTDGPGRPPSDPLEAGVHDMAVSLHRELVRLGVRHTFEDYGPGGHTWDRWQEGLHRTLPAQLALARSRPADPRRFSYRSIQPRYSVFGWDVGFTRAVLEMTRLGDVSPQGFTLSGSGRADVVTAAWYRPGARHDVVVDGRRRVVRADGRGRLRLTVDLGPARAVQHRRVPGDAAFPATARVAIREA